MPPIFIKRRKARRHRAAWRLGIALALALSLCLVNAPFASAQDLAEYFQLSYDPVTFDKSEINGREVFHVIIAGCATCTKDLPLPLPASEAVITSQVVAEHAASGATVTLNPGYTVTIESFPSRQGQAVEISQVLPLQFPVQAASGDYNIIGRIVQAEIKVSIFPPVDVTDYLPQSQVMGTVKYTAPELTEAPPVPAPPVKPAPAPPANPTPAPIPPLAPPPTPEPIFPWWGGLLVLAAIATTVFNITWFLRHRRR